MRLYEDALSALQGDMLSVPEKSSPTAEPLELAHPLMVPSAPRL
jgi:hypothetical protein